MSRIKVGEMFVEIAADADKFMKELDASEKGIAKWAAGVDTALNAITWVGVITGAAAAAASVVTLGKNLTELAKRAAPLEGIGRAFESMSNQFGLSMDEFRQAAAHTISDFDLMKKANMAWAGTTDEVAFAFAERLPDLLLTARAAARLTGESVEYMFQSLINGIRRSSPRLIDNTGLIVELGAAHREYAAELGITVEQMTAQQKALATFNQVADQGVKMAERIGMANVTAAEHMMQLDATMANLTDRIGIAFNPVVKSAATMLRELANEALGPMASLMARTVAPAVDIVIERLHGLGLAAIESGKTFIQAQSATFSQAAQNAAVWGFNIVAQLSAGMIQGAAEVLVAAMNFISRMLEAWLAPGSPPRVAPQLPQWGAAAMEQFLLGFTMADFDILLGVQRPLERALAAMVRAGDIAEELADDILEGLSVILIEGITDWQEYGRIAEEIFDTIAAAGGRFGEQIAELTRRQFAYAEQVHEVRRAEEALTEARTRHQRAQDELSGEIERYNEMLRAGATRQELKAQKDRVDAARERMDTAAEEADQAEMQRDAAQDQLDPLREQIRLQERLIDQMIKFTREQEEAVGGAEAAARAARGAAGAMPTFEEFAPFAVPDIGIDEWDFEGLLSQFEAAREDMLETLTDLFKPIVDEWKKDVQPATKELSTSWGRLAENIGKAQEQWIDPVTDALGDLIPDSLLQNIGKVIGGFFSLSTIMIGVKVVAKVVGLIIAKLTGPIALVILAVALLRTAWEENWGGIQDIMQTLYNDFNMLSIGMSAATDFLTGAWRRFNSAVKAVSNFMTGTLWPALTSVWTWIDNTFMPGWRVFANLLTAVVGYAVRFLGGLFKNVLLPHAQANWQFFKDNLNVVLEALGNLLENHVNVTVERLGELWEALKPHLDAVWQVIEEHVLPSFESAAEIIREGVGAAVEWLSDVALGGLITALSSVWEWFGRMLGRLDRFADSIRSAELPDFMRTRSPTPWETGLRGVADIMDTLSTDTIPRLGRQMGQAMEGKELLDLAFSPAQSMILRSVLAGDGEGQAGNNYSFNMTVNTRAEASTVMRDFELMRQMTPS